MNRYLFNQFVEANPKVFTYIHALGFDNERAYAHYKKRCTRHAKELHDLILLSRIKAPFDLKNALFSPALPLEARQDHKQRIIDNVTDLIAPHHILVKESILVEADRYHRRKDRPTENKPRLF